MGGGSSWQKHCVVIANTLVNRDLGGEGSQYLNRWRPVTHTHTHTHTLCCKYFSLKNKHRPKCCCIALRSGLNFCMFGILPFFKPATCLGEILSHLALWCQLVVRIMARRRPGKRTGRRGLEKHQQYFHRQSRTRVGLSQKTVKLVW